MITGTTKGKFSKQCQLCKKNPSDYKITRWFFFHEYWCERCFEYIEELRILSGSGSIKKHFEIG